ncbi:MAG: helix-turn-helix transcriptional regulator [Pseudomonadota bacterium]
MKSTPEIDQYVRRFGQRVRFIREQKGLSQEELAARAKVHRTYIGMIERGEKNATIVTIVKLSLALEVKAIELVKTLEDA